MIRIIEQLPDGLTRASLAQRTHKAVIAQAARDVFESAKVIGRTIRRRDQEDKNIYRLAVQGFKRHSLGRHRDRADKLLHVVVFAMGDGNATANARGAEQLPFEDGLDDILGLAPLEVACTAKTFD